MSQKVPINGFKWIKKSKIQKKCSKSYDKNYNIESLFEVNAKYPQELWNLHMHNGLPFLPVQMKTNTCEKRLYTLDIKGKYVAHIRSLKQSLNHGLILKRVSKTIKFNQKDWLKSSIAMIK